MSFMHNGLHSFTLIMVYALPIGTNNAALLLCLEQEHISMNLLPYV